LAYFLRKNDEKGIRMMSLFFLFFSIFVSFGAELKTNTEVYSLPQLTGWDSLVGFKGTPYIFTAPMINGFRASISVILVSESDKKIKAEDFFKDSKYYRENKTNWLNNKNGRLIEFDKQINRTLSSDVITENRFSFKFELTGKRFIEISSYLVCNNSLILIKYLNLFDKNFKSSQFIKFIEGIKCTF